MEKRLKCAKIVIHDVTKCICVRMTACITVIIILTTPTWCNKLDGDIVLENTTSQLGNSLLLIRYIFYYIYYCSLCLSLQEYFL